MRTATHYLYIKGKSSPAFFSTLKRRNIFKIFATSLVVSGLGMVFYVVFPILSWQLFYAPHLSAGSFLSPIPRAIMLKGNSLRNVLGQDSSSSFDSTRASTWFPTGNPRSGVSKEYLLSISKLGIKNAKVSVGSDDLSKSLIHYGGSSLPGEYGNAVIFGHSILPQFFSPTNYQAIFSTLHTLKPGDVFEIVADGITYKYVIGEFRIVDPSEISVLEQTFDDSYVTLITCTPPGTYWKRLVVKARIDNI